MILSKIASILFYFAIFIFIILFSYLSKKTGKKIFSVLAVLFPAIIVSLRDGVGTDTSEYINMFDEVSALPINEAIAKVTSFGIEPFAVISIRFLSFLGLKYHFFYLLYALITFGFAYFASKRLRSNDAWLLYSAASIILLPFSINVMRQAAAIAVTTFLFIRLFKAPREIAKNILLFFFAVSLHFSVIMLIPLFVLYPIYKHFGFKKTAVFLSIVIAVSLAFFPSALAFALNHHLLSAKYTETLALFSSNVKNYDFVIFTGLFILLIITRKHNNSYDDQTNDFISLLILCNVFYAGIGFYSAYIGRMSDYFWPTAIIGLWLGIDRFKDSAQLKTGVYLTVIILYFIITCVILGNSQIIPYRFI